MVGRRHGRPREEGDIDGEGTAHVAQERDRPDEVGIGPHPRPWPDDPRLDPVLLAEGDRRNVLDRYRYWSNAAIGTVVRTANAFNASGVHIVGRRRWNRRGAMVTDRYLHVHHHTDAAALASWAADEDLAVVGIDIVPGARPLEELVLPERCVLVFGQEGPGLTADAQAACSLVCSIEQFGSTRSINAGVAAGIAMHTWVRQHALGHDR
jgi:tRNA(Leu) C34 or U34 (ribose-2'-O)-methylase TrmL